MIAKAFGTAFGLTFVAEFGDKTQIAILTLAARYGWLPVFLGACLAFTVLNAVAVTVGAVFARYIPADVIRYCAAALFIIFGLLSFRPEKEETEGDEKRGAHGPFLTSLLAVMLLEIGDKTELALIALTSRFDAPFAIFLGGTLALVATSLIGAIAGKWLARVVPFRWIRWISGVVFIALGILIAVGIL
jgi:Ca2+/H+ antiporter, TMEM165/GDT1 family